MNIILNTAQGKFDLNYNKQQTLENICLVNKLPFQSINFYGQKGDRLKILPKTLNTTIDDYILDNYDAIILQTNRNINLPKVILKNYLVSYNNTKSTEYIFQSENFDYLAYIEFSSEQCFDFIYKKVTAFFNNISVDNRPIIVGISGGGDSNTLLKALLQVKKIHKTQLIAVMCCGLDVWDLAVDRAKYICKEADIQLNIVAPNEICKIIGKKNALTWDTDFFDVFKDSDLDVLGTFVIREVLQHYSKTHNAQAMITGLNLEDLLAESIFQVSKGKLPLPFPIREIDHTQLWYPLYRIPKKILDGCYPKLSLENYEQRHADKLVNRAIPYYFSQITSSLIPGFEYDLLDGFQNLSTLNKSPFIYIKELGFSVTEEISHHLIQKWLYYTNN
ncbi:hypothetical protein H4K35_01635 [Myroides sp. NP-2]|uniref:ATP-binding protein n=1 Tax=Myroides sp. NP-2 TaxID=2759945 RepID=UPI0015FC570B|nr:ATP-binding protein [Myroides sp. NP-2]MBB1148839.1 hypothetical protein [Myroides sp. NP-2]